MSCITTYRLKIFEEVLVLSNYLNLYKINMVHIFHHVWSLFEIMWIAFIVLLLKTLNYLCLLRFFVCLCVEILTDSNLFKCLIANKCSESWVETLQIFFNVSVLNINKFLLNSLKQNTWYFHSKKLLKRSWKIKIMILQDGKLNFTK